MPTVLKIDGFRFHFYSDEGNEPSHIHIDMVKVSENIGFPADRFRFYKKQQIKN